MAARLSSRLRREPVQSIGAIALDPTNPKIVWVGTGESWTRNSVSIGDGIYKSTDGGETWTNMGLPNSERITRIVVDPKDGNTVYACVPGKLWSDSADRGLYKTTDGGETWSLVLKGGNLSTGCSSVTLDPKNSSEMFAGMWDFRRKGWTFRSGGDGPGRAVRRAVCFIRPMAAELDRNDGRRRTKACPRTPWGRVEVVYRAVQSQRVYAFIENRPLGALSSPTTAARPGKSATAAATWCGGHSISRAWSSIRPIPTACSR